MKDDPAEWMRENVKGVVSTFWLSKQKKFLSICVGPPAFASVLTAVAIVSRAHFSPWPIKGYLIPHLTY